VKEGVGVFDVLCELRDFGQEIVVGAGWHSVLLLVGDVCLSCLSREVVGG